MRSDQYLVVLFPLSNKIDKEAQKKYQNEFIKLLRADHTNYVIGNLNRVKEKEKQLVVIVIDLVTTIKRKDYIINNIRIKKATQKPVIAMYSLVVIFDKKVGQFCIDLHALRQRQLEERRARRSAYSICKTQSIDDEELIMRSLAGYGPDPEIFGF